MPAKKPTKTKKELAKQLSEMEKKLSKMDIENRQAKRILEEREKTLEKFQELNAKKRLIDVEDIDDDIESSENEELEEDIVKNSEFEKTLKEFNQNSIGKIEIFRLKENGVHAKVGVFPVKEWGNTLDKIAQKYGGGEYIVHLRDDNGRFAGKTNVYYDEIAYPKPQSSPAYPHFVQQNTPDISELLKTLQEQSEKNTDKFMTMMMTFTQTLAQTLGNKRNLIESLNDVVMIKKLFDNDKKPVETPKDDSPLKQIDNLLKIFQKGIEMGTMTAGTEKNEEPFMELLKMLAPAVTNGLVKPTAKKHPLTEAVENVVKKDSPSKLVQNIPQVETKKEENSMDKTNMILALYKPSILDMAKNNFDAAKTAEMILLRVPEDYYGMCFDLSKNPQRYEFTCKYIPELKEYKEWVEKVFTEGEKILTEFYADQNQGEETETLETETPQDKNENTQV